MPVNYADIINELTQFTKIANLGVAEIPIILNFITQFGANKGLSEDEISTAITNADANIQAENDADIAQDKKDLGQT